MWKVTSIVWTTVAGLPSGSVAALNLHPFTASIACWSNPHGSARCTDILCAAPSAPITTESTKVPAIFALTAASLYRACGQQRQAGEEYPGAAGQAWGIFVCEFPSFAHTDLSSPKIGSV